MLATNKTYMGLYPTGDKALLVTGGDFLLKPYTKWLHVLQAYMSYTVLFHGLLQVRGFRCRQYPEAFRMRRFTSAGTGRSSVFPPSEMDCRGTIAL